MGRQAEANDGCWHPVAAREGASLGRGDGIALDMPYYHSSRQAHEVTGIMGAAGAYGPAAQYEVAIYNTLQGGSARE